MKKVININIAGSVFYVEDDAFATLQNYLDSVSKHFSSLPDHEEVVKDFEARIAERFLERPNGKEAVITKTEVDELIKNMGTVEDFNKEEQEDEKKHTGNQNQNKAPKKLFRNPDDKMIAGVASGLAAYIGAEPTLVRLVFLVFLLFGGSAILFYIILWIIMPEAKTPTEKMQMSGEAVTLATLDETLKKKVETGESNKLNRVISLPIQIISQILKFIIHSLLPIVLRVIGGIITIASGIATVTISIIFVNLLFNLNSPLVDFPVKEAISGTPFIIGLTALFITVTIPLVVIFLAGMSLSSWKNKFHAKFTWAFLFLWIAAISTASSIGVKYAPEIKQVYQNHPNNRQVIKTFEITDFKNITADGADIIYLTQEEKTSARAEGRSIDIERLRLTVENETLKIDRNWQEEFKICIFCNLWHGRTKIYVSSPSIENLKLDGAVKLEAVNITADKLEVNMNGASSAQINSLSSPTIRITLDGASHLTLRDNANNETEKTNPGNLQAILDGASRLAADEFTVKQARVETDGVSRAYLHVTEKLVSKSDGASTIRYLGNPTLETNAKGASKVERLSEVISE